ncbi:MAG: NADH-quinone oxidoreductase subunit K [Thermoleophilia bacterium]
MANLSPQILLLIITVLFAAAVFLHLTRKNYSALQLYMVQSTAIAVLLFSSLLERFSVLGLIALVATVLVKIGVTPYYFSRLIRRHQLKYAVSTYLSTPLTLVVVSGLVALTQSGFFQPLAGLSAAGDKPLRLAFATILISIFLCISRRGALSQILGILSMENGIVAFAMLAGLEQSPGLQLGITFNILIWVTIATVFAAMIFRQFGSLDVTAMKHLKD